MRYVALLRGINVSGQKKIKMAELRAQLSDIGLDNVETYIQSGNIVFEYKKTAISKLEKMISDMIMNEYGWEVPTMVRTADTFEYVLKNNPYKKMAPDKTAVTFLSAKPSAAAVKSFDVNAYPPEELVIDGDKIFSHSPNGFGRAKFTNNFIEKKLKVRATSRNFKTVNVLAEMISQ